MAADGRPIVNGARIATEAGIVSKNPATLEAVGAVGLASAAQCAEAIAAARAAFPLWAGLPAAERRAVFRRAKQALMDRMDEAARLITREKGSPVVESLTVEVQGALGLLDYYARNHSPALRTRRIGAHVGLFGNKTNAYRFQPLGPTLVISPWNFPFLISLADTVSALTAGNTVVLRPSTSTSLIGLLVGEIFLEAGIPPGALNVVPCRTAQAEEMILNPRVVTVMFTGSVGTGSRVMELASRNLTNIVLELGGKDPMIVCGDADLERAARGAVWAAFMNTGQSCASIERVYVAREVAGPFTDRVVALAKALRIGDPLDPGVDIGPMTTEGQLETVVEHVRDAREKGAVVLAGGERPAGLPGYFHQPTVLANVDHRMKVMTEETFGPVLPIMAVGSEDEAVALANDSRYGLTASVWTRNRKRAAVLAERLEAGTVTINDHMFSFTEPKAIWGGIKDTGAGRTHGPYGLLHLVNIKFVSSDFHRGKAPLWWFPYAAPKPDVLRKSLVMMHHGRLGTRLKTLVSLTPRIGFLARVVPLRSLAKIVAGLFR